MNNTELLRLVMSKGDQVVIDKNGTVAIAMEYDRDVDGVARVDYVVVYEFKREAPFDYEPIAPAYEHGETNSGPFEVLGRMVW